MPPPAVTFTFDLLTYLVCSRTKYTHDPILAKLAQIFTNILYSSGILWSLLAVTLTFDLWSQKLIGTSTNSNTYVTKIGWNSIHWFVRYGVCKVFRSLPALTLTYDLWPNHYIPGTGDAWPNFGKIGSNIYEDIVLIRYIMAIACCDLDLWPLTPKANQHTYEPQEICDKN